MSTLAYEMSTKYRPYQRNITPCRDEGETQIGIEIVRSKHHFALPAVATREKPSTGLKHGERRGESIHVRSRSWESI